ncbi:MAG: hypothetical protein ACOC95_05460, partial [Planctomycetota bacterium]
MKLPFHFTKPRLTFIKVGFHFIELGFNDMKRGFRFLNPLRGPGREPPSSVPRSVKPRAEPPGEFRLFGFCGVERSRCAAAFQG